MASGILKRGITVLLTLCMLLGCLSGVALISSASGVEDMTERNYVTMDNVTANMSAGGRISTPANVADGDSASIWGQFHNSSMCLTSDFGREVTITKIYIETKEEGNWKTDKKDQESKRIRGEYKIEGKTGTGEGNGWEVLQEKVDAKSKKDGGVTIELANGKKVSAIRVTITAWYTDSWAGISELKAIGPVDGGRKLPLIEDGDYWRYWYKSNEDGQAVLPSDWHDANVNTTSDEWKDGRAPFANNAAEEGVTITKVSDGDEAAKGVFVRHFDVLDPEAVKTIAITLLYDENPEIYLNGEMILDSDTTWNCASGGLSWNGYFNEPKKYHTEEMPVFLFQEAVKHLKPGDNVITVFMENNHGGYHFGMRLDAYLESPTKLYGTEEETEGVEEALVYFADYDGDYADEPAGLPENMFDDDPNTCAGDNFNEETGLAFDFYFGDEVELNYLFLELKNEGSTPDPTGCYGHYAIYVPDDSRAATDEEGFRLVLGEIPAYPAGTENGGMGGCYVKLEDQLTTDHIRIKITDWCGEGCWANIATFRAWKTLDDACTIRFAGDGEEAEDVANFVVRAGESLHTLKVPKVPEKEGYTACGWSQSDFSNITESIDVEPVYYLNGDVNGDGELSIRDVSRLLLRLADEEIAVYGTPDLDGEEGESIADVAALLTILAQ